MKLFYLVSRVPYPLDKGDKLRAYHQLVELSKANDIYLCCLSEKPTDENHIQHLKTFCHEVHVIQLNKIVILLRLLLTFFNSLPFQVNYFYQKEAHKQISQLIRRIKPDHLFCQLIRTSEYVKKEYNIPKTLDYMDVFSKGIERRIKKSKLKFLFRIEAKRLIRYEHLIFDYFDNKTIISDQDRSLIYHKDRNDIHIIPNGIDVEKFTHINVPQLYDLVFVGNMSYAPNVECAHYLANEIMPRLLQIKPDAKLLLAGATPSKSVKTLACNHITISGWIDDIRTAYASGKIFIAPLMIGTGLQNKLLEAMAMEVPCITSNLANNALGATDGKEILIGNAPEEFINHILLLLNNPSYAEELATKGKKYVAGKYSWHVFCETLNNLMDPKHIVKS